MVPVKLAEKILDSKQSVAFETVMLYDSKVKLIELAKSIGYMTYSYFVFADDPQTNIAPVKLRVLKGEQDVNEPTIKGRIPKTFDLLPAPSH